MAPRNPILIKHGDKLKEFTIEWAKTHVYFTTKTIAWEYMKKEGMNLKDRSVMNSFIYSIAFNITKIIKEKRDDLPIFLYNNSAYKNPKAVKV